MFKLFFLICKVDSFTILHLELGSLISYWDESLYTVSSWDFLSENKICSSLGSPVLGILYLLFWMRLHYPKQSQSKIGSPPKLKAPVWETGSNCDQVSLCRALCCVPIAPFPWIGISAHCHSHFGHLLHRL